jgi:hypothetical protein
MGMDENVVFAVGPRRSSGTDKFEGVAIGMCFPVLRLLLILLTFLMGQIRWDKSEPLSVAYACS